MKVTTNTTKTWRNKANFIELHLNKKYQITTNIKKIKNNVKKWIISNEKK